MKVDSSGLLWMTHDPYTTRWALLMALKQTLTNTQAWRKRVSSRMAGSIP